MVALVNLVAFGSAAGLGVIRGRDTQAHKRLIVIGTINLSIAAVNRLPFRGLAAARRADSS
jgi:hypothetical protein